MSYNGFATTAYFQETGSAPVTAAPLTMCCWFYSTNSATNQALVAIQRASDQDYFGLAIDGSRAGDPVYCYINGSGLGNVNTDTASGYSTNTWHHACAVFTSSTDRSVFINGGSKGTSTTSRTPVSLSKFVVGAYVSLSASSPLSGSIAEIGIWNVALTDSEVVSLARGISPAKIRPQSLVRYRPFVRSTQCVRSAATLTATGAPTVAVHPRIYNAT